MKRKILAGLLTLCMAAGMAVALHGGGNGRIGSRSHYAC